jgi:hypothetical protein
MRACNTHTPRHEIGAFDLLILHVYPRTSKRSIYNRVIHDENRAMTGQHSTSLTIIFFSALCVSLFITFFTIVIQQQFVVFTDEESVPEGVDFFATIPEYMQRLWTR